MLTYNSSRQLLSLVKNRLASSIEQEEQDSISRLIVEYFSGMNYTEILADKPLVSTPESSRQLESLLQRISNQEPVQYVFGKAWFYGREFTVNPSVLIPRQETEELVHQIIKHCTFSGVKIWDIGTGSGCISVSLAIEMPDAEVWASDISEEALETARRNASAHRATVRFFQDDIRQTHMQERVDVIVSNPPYIPINESTEMSSRVTQHEPHMALFTPQHDPLLFYRTILFTSEYLLNEGGVVFFEIHENQGASLQMWANEQGWQSEILTDLNGKDRMMKLERKAG